MGLNLTQIINKILPVQIKGSDVAVPIDLQYHDINTQKPIPVGLYPRVVKLLDSREIRTAEGIYYDTAKPEVVDNYIDPMDLMMYKNIKICIHDTHNADAESFNVRAGGILVEDAIIANTVIYKSETILKGENKIITLQPDAAGEGADPSHIVVPCLRSASYGRLGFYIKYATLPTTGSLKIYLVLN